MKRFKANKLFVWIEKNLRIDDFFASEYRNDSDEDRLKETENISDFTLMMNI